MTDTESDIAVVEQAKGAIMLRYGVSSRESLAAMSRWAREADLSLPDLAHVLITGICQGHVSPETRVMVRWLEQRLRTDITEATEATEAADATEVTEAVAPRRRRTTPASRSAATAAVSAARRWRYSSAVHAARALSSP